jgi:hypothetical protein
VLATNASTKPTEASPGSRDFQGRGRMIPVRGEMPGDGLGGVEHGGGPDNTDLFALGCESGEGIQQEQNDGGIPEHQKVLNHMAKLVWLQYW